MSTFDQFIADERNRALVVTTWLANGTLDASLDTIVSAVSNRRATLTNIKSATLEPGTRVRVNNRVRPKYLTGLTGTVVGKEDKFIVVRPDTQYRIQAKKYLHSDGAVRITAGSLEVL